MKNLYSKKGQIMNLVWVIHMADIHITWLVYIFACIVCLLQLTAVGSTQAISKTLFGWPPNNNAKWLSCASKRGRVQNKQKAMQLMQEKFNKNTRNTMNEQSGKKEKEKGK